MIQIAKKKMTRKKTVKKKEKCCKADFQDHCSSGLVYCLGVMGALVYYISTATSFWNGVLGVLKALIWPAFLVFEAMKFLGM